MLVVVCARPRSQPATVASERLARPDGTAMRTLTPPLPPCLATRVVAGRVLDRTHRVASLAMVAPQPLPRTSARHRRGDSLPRLIVADAAIALVERWKTELAIIRRRSPASDAAKALADCVGELVDAINAGQALTVQLTISEASTVSHIPVSTLRWLCKNKPDVVGAHKREGIWYVDRSHFERYLASADNHAPVLPEPPSRVSSPLVTDRAVDLLADSRADLRLELR